ncbi:MAG: hypothetical protein Q9M32_02975 [Sulfurimonas sp.]|nr:hypothetical protein [Sulfurimonas sp.]
MRLKIDEYCKNFKMSREMINSKLRAKKLNYIIEDGITYIIVTNKSLSTPKVEATQTKETASPVTTLIKPKTTVATVLALYQRENQQLKEKIIQLESKVDKLIDDKEQMLRDEMQKIEQVYSAKDEQLKTILELLNTKLMMDNNAAQIHETQAINNKEIEEEQADHQVVELRTYIKTLDLKSYQRKIIKKRFLASFKNDVRIIQQNGLLYLDFSKYDYSDLLEY